jgi:adenylate cyclase
MTARILVVDDEPDLEALIVQRFRRQVRAGELSFCFAADGVAALAMLAEDAGIDMVLTDINMPRMDGLTLLQNIQAGADHKATVIVSAYGDMSNIRTAMNRGAFDFLTKPIDFADLEATIAKTLRSLEQLRDLQRRQQEAERARVQLARYFSPAVALSLAAAEDPALLAPQRREVTALFTDIAGFTSLAEGLPPAEIAALLNDYLSALTEVVFAQGGTLIKIIGDALHVLFGAPADQPDHAARAVACALALDARAEAVRAEWRSRGVVLGATRIGLHSGPALVGSFGGSGFFDYTAYGDTINTASRLEAANKLLGTRICASATVVAEVPGFIGRPVGRLRLRGRSEPLAAFEPLTAARAGDALTAGYAEAFRLADTGDAGAIGAFAALLGQAREDGLVGFHLKRLLDGQHGMTVDLG